MAKMIRTIGMIAGAVALVATGIGAVAGGAIIGTAVGAAGPVAVTLGSVTSTVATAAGIAAGVANIGAQLLYKPPPARGSVTRLIIDPDAPQPYVMGEGYVAGVLRYQRSYGATLKKVPNPYRWMVIVYSGGGPVESITPYVDQLAVTSWYSGYLYTDSRLGDCPEPSALTPAFAGAPNWDASSKLSGLAKIGWNLKFDKDGKRFASGMPQLGAYGKWVKVYDPRKDSTFAGGSGGHRLHDETTWEWSENPALHAGTYAYGRYQNGKRVMGIGLAADAIDWPTVAAWANVCEANGWTIFGVVYEPMPETRMPNLRDIAAAGGGKPIIVGGKLSFHYAAPRVVLDTFTEDDLADGPGSVTAMKGRRERLNTLVPKYREPEQNWEMVASGAAVTSSTYVTEDGEERKAEWPFNLVKDKDQAAQLAAYTIADSRELQPITLTFGHRVRAYKPGDCVHLDIPTLALDTDAVIVSREYNHAAVATTFTFIGETPAKHPWALGLTGTAPATPGLKQTGQERDELLDAALKPYGWQLAIIRTATINNPRDTSDVSRPLLKASDAGSTATISVARHDWDYPDGAGDITRELGTVTGLSFATTYHVYFDDPDLDLAAPTYHATTDQAAALNSSDHPDRHYLGSITTPADGGADTYGSTAGTALSVVELTIYKRAASAPSTPSGGSFNFGSLVLTPPSGWSSSMPAIDGNPLYVARGIASVSGASGTATPSWAAPAKALQDAEAVNAIFRRQASQPSTPAPSSGVPVGWTDAPVSGANPLWVSYGTRPSPVSNWTWITPARVEGVDGIDGTDGVDGADAKLLKIYPLRQGIGYDQHGAASPSVQTNTFFAEKMNTTATVNWSVQDLNGNARTPTTTYLSAATGNSVTQTISQFEAAANGSGGVIVTATLVDGSDTLTHTATVLKVEAGAAAIGFAQTTSPGSGQFVGQIWLDTDDKLLYRWTGSAWVQVQGDLSAFDIVTSDLLDYAAVTSATEVTRSGTLAIDSTDGWYPLVTAGITVTDNIRAEFSATWRFTMQNPQQGDEYELEFKIGRTSSSSPSGATDVTDVVPLSYVYWGPDISSGTTVAMDTRATFKTIDLGAQPTGAQWFHLFARCVTAGPSLDFANVDDNAKIKVNNMTRIS